MTTRLSAIDFTSDLEKLTKDFTGRQWVFDDIDLWLRESEERFFILTGEPGVGKSAIAARLTQIRDDVAAYHFCRAGDVETVRPGRILRSLAAQLGEHLIDYGQALANTIKPVHLRVEVNITIGSMTGSQVTGVYIENLKESDPENELDILIRAPLEALQKMYAERQQAQPTLAIILIDSLDEAVMTTGTNLVKLLTQLSNSTSLPSWVRFILTSRPEDRVLRGFKPLKHHHLQEKSDESLADIQRYVEDRVDQPALQERLQVNQVQPQILIREIKNLSDGSFLYTTLLLNDIEAGRQALDNLAALPKSIDDIYHSFLSRFSEEDWSDRYKPIFGVLTVAQEPISERQIANFTKVDPEDVRDSIRIARQFFDVELDEQKKETYAIFHQSLRDYLLDEDRNADFWCNERKQHQRIIKYCKRTSKSWQELERIDAYGRKHLAHHLVKADCVEKLHKLLSLEKDGKNVWFKVKDDEGETASFLADVELAWSQADEVYEREPGRSVGLQCRYALIKASISSLAEISPELTVALVKHRLWKPAKALAYARQVSDPEARIKSLTALATQLHSEESLKYQALESALQAALMIKSPSLRADVLITLIDILPDALLAQVLVSAQAIERVSLRVRVLKALADKMPPTLFSSAWKVAQEIRPASARARVLASLVEKFPNALPKTLTAAQVIQNEADLADILVSVVGQLPDAMLSEALVSAQAIQDHSKRARVLTALADKLPDAVPEALEAAQVIQFEPFRVTALMALVDKLTPDLLPQALSAAQTIQDPSKRTRVLTALAGKLPEAIPAALVEAAQVMQNKSGRADILWGLVDKLTPNLLPQALSAVQLMTHEPAQAAALMALVGKLTPDLFPQALSTAQAIRNNRYRTDVLKVLSDKLHEPQVTLCQSLPAAQAIEKEHHCGSSLGELSEKLPDTTLSEGLGSAQAIQDNSNCTQALVEKLTPNLLPITLEAAQRIQDEAVCAKTLAALKDKQTSNLLPQALKLRSRIQLKSSSTDANRAWMDKLRSTIRSIDANQAVIDKLRSKTHFEIWQEVESSSSKSRNESDFALVLPTLVDELPSDLLPAALTATQAIWSESYRADVLSTLADKLPPNLLPQALSITQGINNEFARAHALIALSDKLPPDLLSEALSIAQSIKDMSIRTDVLTVISDSLLKAPDRSAVWKDLLHFLSHRTRSNLLSDLATLTPVITALGGETAVSETAQAIRDVSHWWP